MSEYIECLRFVAGLAKYRKTIRYSHIGHGLAMSTHAAAVGKRMGLAKGVPDYLLVHRLTKAVLWVEMKRVKPTKGRVSAEQREWLELLGGVVCYGATDALQIVEDWMKRENKRANRPAV